MVESSASSNELLSLGLPNTPLTSRRMNLSFNPDQAIPSRVIGRGRGMSSNDAGAGGRYNAEDVVNDELNTNLELSNKNKKRGRPRKKDTDAFLALGMPNSSAAIHSSSGVGVKISPGETSMPPSQKKRIGRPPGAKSKPKTQGESDLKLHVLNVEAGKDVHNAIVSFVENTVRSFCILTAHGEVSKVVLGLASSTVPLPFQGRLKIISLTGTSLPLADNSGHWKREGSLNLVLSDRNGNVLGGEVAGYMEAASRVQVMMWSFLPSSFDSVNFNF